MTRTAAVLIFIISSAVLAVTILIICASPAASAGFKDSAAVLTFVGGAAVAIERTIEALWTVVGGVAGTYWPLNLINTQVKTMVGELDQAIQPIYEDAQEMIDTVGKEQKWADEKVREAKQEVANLQARFNELKEKLPPDNERVQLLVAAASQHVDYLRKKYEANLPNLNAAAAIAGTAIDGLQNFIASFKDNPGRRLISIYLGVILGLAVAGYFGLDLFQAVLKDTAQSSNHLNIILTGVVVGLGSNPTHEVIRALQEYKKARKGENVAKPDLP